LIQKTSGRIAGIFVFLNGSFDLKMEDLEITIHQDSEPKSNPRPRKGQKIGRATVLSYSHNKSNVNQWNWRCDCGNEGVSSISTLKKKKDGGCRKCFSKLDNYWKKPKDYVGHIFGELKVISFSKNEGGHTYWNCECSCGKRETLSLASLKRSGKKSCQDCYIESRFTGENNPRYKKDVKIGQKINNLTITKIYKKDRKTYCLCKCDCGENKEIYINNIFLSKTCKSCALKKKQGENSGVFKDIKGQKFNNLTAVSLSHFDKGAYWNCVCDCGGKAVVKSANLTFGQVKTCGCRASFFKNKNIHLIGQKIGKYKILDLVNILNDNGENRSFLKCECECGKISFIRPKGAKILASKSCYGCWDKRGDKNPNYDPSITDEERFSKRVLDPLNREWIKLVKKRDHYKCQITGKTGSVCAHHVESWNKNKELRYDVNNGITILKSLHIEFHKRYGLGDNTRQQYEEFIFDLQSEDLNSYPAEEIVLTKEEKKLIINHLTILIKNEKEKRRSNGNVYRSLTSGIKYTHEGKVVE
jgi:hypothetical protein